MKKLILALAICATISTAHAEQSAVAMPGDNRLVTFNYDENNTYTVLTIPDAVTDIQLTKGEKVTAMAVGDNLQWVIAKAEEHVFVKPAKPNIFTSATIVTDKRSYQLTLRSSPPGGKWYQRVSWSYPKVMVYQQEVAKTEADLDQKTEQLLELKRKKLESIVVNDSSQKTTLPVEAMNFDYQIQGNAPFKPKTVFDDGKFTYLGLSKDQELPAFFLRDEDGKYELVNYVRDGEFLKVQRLFKVGVLKLANKEIVITNVKADAVASKSTREYAKQTIPGFQ
ncbi:TrbG/VirB9 family P-type conjugative transfer protein [Methylophilus sp. QUAN]|uniref:TrbG/VirB9 family P-type conjugative transfer protein n=1 Tax=Methylophilus sp. QUAN TaxID=2781020 RepID=UPI0018906EF7|nr:TrbG/VirB9 family P-type conjugative transfer protein [Methylophilus sp. QUAN]MBF4990984.1 TrbG/VirB9 family P-type conjugative transfer protein [Methylophilus sp. QUAN]